MFPQGPYFAPRADGRYLRLPDGPAERHRELAKFSAADAAAYPAYEARMREIGQVLGPMLREIPARLGSRRPADLARQGMLLRHTRGLRSASWWTRRCCRSRSSPTSAQAGAASARLSMWWPAPRTARGWQRPQARPWSTASQRPGSIRMAMMSGVAAAVDRT